MITAIGTARGGVRSAVTATVTATATSRTHHRSSFSAMFMIGSRRHNSNESKQKQQQQSSSSSFRPRRRSNNHYRPLQLNAAAAGKKKKSKKQQVNIRDWSPGNDHKFVNVGSVPNPRDELEAAMGPLAADMVRSMRRQEQEKLTLDERVEEAIRMVDYFNAEDGSTEDLVGERRAMALDGLNDLKSREKFKKELDAIIREGRLQNMGLLDDEDGENKGKEEQNKMLDLFDDTEETDMEARSPETALDRNQLAHGQWSEMLITVDRTIKLWRGGRLESYRALVVGGNMNGCGGFGIGKSSDPLLAVDIAGRHCKRNIFFVDRYQGNGLTRDLVGKQNSCVLTIRATDNGLRGNPLCAEILMRFGITNAVSKSHGNRNPYNVVRATFKALMTHESIEEIALKRGKRIVSIDRAMRMQV